ncbi:oxygen-insensitive NADPH nitroreductase [Pseudalkalibacillus berkeleyi]|uniref:Oxygen-insensitive NADPH nitroreductase n=1 Tax=Pseudalkalibacillus berkeleyi TaxID=1069813 RepID=A0ABS9GXB0_9BACL|nr:oxygen-insensitive NADPH nitroreductase [Pseudalkalibacillus berkeleyi]MCF6136320.1 oxygen-insensitive NADPH nitroreductase [Pseudalkalibacillus berkeleyi]
MNETIQTIMNHRSIRAFKDEPLSEEQITTIVKSAQAAATSSYLQVYSIIGVKDPAKKKKLAELAGNQEYVEKNGHFFVFCADLNRHKVAVEMEGLTEDEVVDSLESTEKFMVGTIDATLAAQNAALAAESMGLGICYIGGLRNNLEEVAEILKTPDRVIPLFGMCVGVPDQNPDQKQRLPLENIYHVDEYQQDETKFIEQLASYNEDIGDYYRERTQGERTHTWTEIIATKMSKPMRLYMKDFLKRIRIPLK